MCCPKRNELQFRNIFCVNKFAVLCSVDLLYYVFNCITETIQVTEGHMLATLAQDDQLREHRLSATVRVGVAAAF